MKTRQRLFVLLAGACAVLLLVPFSPTLSLPGAVSEAVAGSPASSAYQAAGQGSEHYQLAALALGEVPAAMQSSTYQVNEGLTIQAESAPLMNSEHYRAGGIIPWRVHLPVVLRASG